MRSLIFLSVLVLVCGSAWGVDTSTSSCPTVENGKWIHHIDSFYDNSELWYWHPTTWVHVNNYREYDLWRKVPYEIEWECYSYKPVLDFYGFLKDTVCSRWIGFREDGIVVWKKEE